MPAAALARSIAIGSQEIRKLSLGVWKRYGFDMLLWNHSSKATRNDLADLESDRF
jgi:hypothetical protein